MKDKIVGKVVYCDGHTEDMIVECIRTYSKDEFDITFNVDGDIYRYVQRRINYDDIKHRKVIPGFMLEQCFYKYVDGQYMVLNDDVIKHIKIAQEDFEKICM